MLLFGTLIILRRATSSLPLSIVSDMPEYRGSPVWHRSSLHLPHDKECPPLPYVLPEVATGHWYGTAPHSPHRQCRHFHLVGNIVRNVFRLFIGIVKLPEMYPAACSFSVQRAFSLRPLLLRITALAASRMFWVDR